MASDQDRFDTAYEAFRDLSSGLYDIDTTRHSRGVTSGDAPGVELADGEEKLRDLVHLPRKPLAHPSLGGQSKQIDRLLEGHCLDPGYQQWKSYPDSNALDMDLSRILG